MAKILVIDDDSVIRQSLFDGLTLYGDYDVTVAEDADDTVIDLTNVFTDVDNDPALITKVVQQNNNPTIVTATITNGNTLNLNYQPNQSGTATIAIRATSGGQTVDDVFLVTVNAINDPPTVLNPIADVTVDEDADNTVIDLTNVFTDTDNDPTLIVKTVQNNSNETLVTATITNGNTLTLDYQSDQSGTANITIRATSGSQSVDDVFLVTVNPVNDPLTLANPIDDVSVAEDAANTIIDLTDVFLDVDDVVVKTVQENDNETLVTATITNDNTLTLDYQPNQIGTANITIRGTVGSEFLDDQFVVTVSGINDPPVLTLPDNFQFNEDDSLVYSISQLYDWISDPDDPDSVLQLVVNIGKYITVSSDSAGITFKAPANWNGVDTLKVIVSDSALADSANIIVTVNALNDAPVFVDLPETIEFANTADTSFVMSDYVDDVDLPQDNLSWEFSVDNDTITYQFNTETTELTLSAPGWMGSATLTVTVSDDSSAEVTADITINVTGEPTAISDLFGDMPRKYELHQNYPNPFNPETSIKFGLPQAAKVQVVVYNIVGQQVTTILDEFKPAGYHAIKFNAGNFPSGIYFYHIKTSKFSQVKKMVLLK